MTPSCRTLLLDNPSSWAGLEDTKAALLVVISALKDGSKVVLAVRSGQRESKDCWARYLRERGLRPWKATVADLSACNAQAGGHPGIWAALAKVCPQGEELRWWNHRIINVIDQLPKKRWAEAREPLRHIASLAIDTADPRERLGAIAASTQRGKEHLQSLPRSAITQYTLILMARYIGVLLTGLGGRIRSMFNVTISDVLGPRQPLYFHGARLQATYPVSLVTHGQALNITCQSYAGALAFGFTGCRDTVPSLQRIAVYTGEALEELRRALTSRRRDAGGRQRYGDKPRTNGRMAERAPRPAAGVKGLLRTLARAAPRRQSVLSASPARTPIFRGVNGLPLESGQA